MAPMLVRECRRHLRLGSGTRELSYRSKSMTSHVHMAEEGSIAYCEVLKNIQAPLVEQGIVPVSVPILKEDAV